MTEPKDPRPADKPDPNELTDEQLEKVPGGFAPQPEPPRIPRQELPGVIKNPVMN
jgi:hypothetical protein